MIIIEDWSLKNDKKKDWDWAFTFLGQIIGVWLEEFVIDAMAEDCGRRSWLMLNYHIAVLRMKNACIAYSIILFFT